MKLNRIVTVICALALFATVGSTAFAVTPTDITDEDTKPAITDSVGKRERPVFTDEQRSEMEARRAKMDASQEKWLALTDAQKEEIYALKEDAANIQIQTIDKYLELGIIDEATATEMKGRIADRAQMREDGIMPMLGGKGGPGQGKHGFECTPPSQ